MLLVITGATCSGRHTLAEHLSTKIAKTDLLRIITTKVVDDPRYCSVTDSIFEESASDYILLPSEDIYRYGISRTELYAATQDVDSVVVLICSSDEALALARHAPRFNFASLCVYLHCRHSELVERLSTKLGPTAECYDEIHDIYADHNTNYSKLEDLSNTGNGFTATMPISTSKTTLDIFGDTVVSPLISVLDSFSSYKTMRQLRNTTHTLGVSKNAN